MDTQVLCIASRPIASRCSEVRAKIFKPGVTVATVAAAVVDPGNSHALAQAVGIDMSPRTYHRSNHLMAKNHGERSGWCSTLDFIKFCVAYTANVDFDQQIIRSGMWAWELSEPQG